MSVETHRSSSWRRDSVGDAYIAVYAGWWSSRQIDAEVNGITAMLGLPSGSRILDLGCGYGRHDVALARRGYQVVGLDVNERCLKQARCEALDADARVSWVRADMRAIPFPPVFDGATCVFTSFGYSDDDTNARMLRQIRGMLKPGGRFLLDVTHPNCFKSTLSSRSTRVLDSGVEVTFEHRYDAARQRNHITHSLRAADGRTSGLRFTVRIYSAAELSQLLKDAGLRLLGWYGSLDGRPVEADSHRLIAINARAE